MAKKWIIVSHPSFGVDQKQYIIPPQHPDEKFEPGFKPLPGITVQVGKPTCIEVKDARHEEVLKWDPRIKFIDAPVEAKAQKKDDKPPEDEGGQDEESEDADKTPPDGKKVPPVDPKAEDPKGKKK